MKKGETRIKIRWGDFEKLRQHPYEICMQIRMRGGMKLRTEIKDSTTFLGCNVNLGWISGNVELGGKIILDNDGRTIWLARYFENKKEAEKFLDDLDNAIKETKRDYLFLIKNIEEQNAGNKISQHTT